MRLQGRNLTFGMTGEDVAALQTELARLGYDIPQAERHEASFGKGTALAATQFRTTVGLPESSSVDAVFARALDAAARPPSETWTVDEAESAANAALVHRALAAVGIDVADEERERGTFGPTTRAAVARLQLLAGMEATGSADRRTLDLARAALERLAAGAATAGRDLGDPPFKEMSRGELTIFGVVSDHDGLPMPGVVVLAYRRQLRDRMATGRAATNDQGKYVLRFGQGGDTPDLELEVVDATGALVYTSPVQHKVTDGTEIPLALGGRTQPPEHAELGRAMSSRLGNLRPEEIEQSARNHDVSFLAADTGFAKSLIALYAAAARLQAKTDLPAELFYGLFRQNVPADAAIAVLASSEEGADLDKNAERLLTGLLQASSVARQKALDTAISAGVIVPSYAERAAEDLARLDQLATKAALQSNIGLGKTPIAEVLSAANVPPPKQERFVELYRTADRTDRAFWQKLATLPDFSSEEVATLRFTTEVGRSTRGHMPLINALLTQRNQGALKGTRDLARKSAAEWKKILVDGGVGIPANFSAQDHEQAVEAYAHVLERNFERAHPTTAFSARLAEDPESPLPAKESVTAFLDEHPNFSLVRSNVDGYLQKADVALEAETRGSLLAAQRVVKVADRYANARPLLQSGITTSQQIYAMGKSQFVEQYGKDPAVGPAQAARIYAVSEQTYGMALATLANFHAPLVGVDPTAIKIPKTAMDAKAPPPAGGPAPAPALDLTKFPNLATLFGSLDACACQHCRSVLSPAAYMVDLLHFLNKRVTAGKSAKAVLLERRPDLAQIELTCANTNTVLPYIDLVNELLEDAVAPPADPVAAARARQTSLTTEELTASPEHVNTAAYTTLAAQVFPRKLPFDLPLLEARSALSILGTDRVALMRTFGQPADDAVAVEGLGLSKVEADIVLGTDPHKGWEFWGLAETGNTVTDPIVRTRTYTGGWLDVLSHVRIALDRAGLKYADLPKLLNTTFINPTGAVQIVCTPPESCDVGNMTLTGLTADVAERLHRFVRLQRRLGWDAYDLDSAIARLQAGTPAGVGRLNAVLLRQLYAVATAAQRYGLRIPVAISLLGRIETRDVPPLPGEDTGPYSLYRDLFQNRAVISPLDPIFALNPTGTEIAGIAGAPKLADSRATLVAAFEVPDADLSLAIEAFTDGKLTLTNLGILHRHVVLAKGLGLSLAELRSAKALVEQPTTAAPFFAAIDPFDAAKPEQLDLFALEVARVRSSRFDLASLDYLLRDVVEPGPGVTPAELTVGTLLKSVRDKLVKLRSEHPDTSPEYATLGAGLVAHELSEALSLPTAVVAELIGSWLKSPTDATKPLLADFLALPTVARAPVVQDTPIAKSEAGFPGYFTSFTALSKAASVVAGFALTTEDTKWLRTRGVAAGLLDPTALPLTPKATPEGRYARWRRLGDFAGIKTALPGETPVQSLMDLAAGGGDKATYQTGLVARSGWSADNVKTVTGDPAVATDKGLLGLVYPDDYKSEIALARLVPAFAMLRKLGIPADAAWLGATITAPQASALTRTVKAKYTNARWAEVAEPMRDTLREYQRDALVAYLLAHAPAGVGRWYDANDVYARYLIDVEMGACQKTSRIVQANATIQLFVQRCMLNLEPAVTVDAKADGDWLQWRWLSRYRVWEANRKVFLYPENWVSPELRREKSPFFQDMENELMQAEVTKDTAEDAFRGYLEKLDQVARLEMVGMYHEPGEPSVLHVIGRKAGNPPTHYYRQWIDSSRWTAWRKIDLDITGDHVVPIVWNRRLHLFWAVVTRKPDALQTTPPMSLSGGTPPPATTHQEVQLAWSEFKAGKWQPTQTSPQLFPVPFEQEAASLTLRTTIADPLLRVDVFADLDWNRKHVGQFVLGGVGSPVEAYRVAGQFAPIQWNRVGPSSWALGELTPALELGTIPVPTNSVFQAQSLASYAHTVLDAMRQRVASMTTTYEAYGALTTEVVLDQADRYKLLIPHQTTWFDSKLPFFYSDARRSYFVIPTVYYKSGGYFTTTTAPAYYHPESRARYLFAPNYHAFVPLLIRELNAGGVDRLFRRELQLDPAAIQGVPNFDFKAYYKPTANALEPYPSDGIDFEPEASYSIYNWELFYHAPMQIGLALSRNQRFEEAKHWYEYIFNPASPTKEPEPQRYWITKPFFQMTAKDYEEQSIAGLMKLINHRDPKAEHQVAQWRANPFDPHIIAALRPVAYQRAIVMRYLDNLLAWGDRLFAQDTMESINEATQLYVLCSELLGARPELVPKKDDSPPQTYADLEPKLDEFSNALAAAENTVGPVAVNVPVDPSTPKLPILPPLYFSIPPNEELLRYWDTVEDRLFKVRHCMNLQGVVRQLALFAPAIDPGMLVKAAAAGLDLGSVLSDSAAAAPPYRFRVLLREALELTEVVRGLGSQLLTCLQLRDADKLDLLRSGAERTMQDRIKLVQQRSVDAASNEIDVLAASRAVVADRQKYFDDQTQDLMNTWEAVSMALTGGSVVAQIAAGVLEAVAGSAAIVVRVQFGASGAGGSPHATVSFGGENVSGAAAGWARVSKIVAAALQTGAQMAAVTAQYQRRQDDWSFQRDQAGKELAQIDVQTAGAKIRKEIAEKHRDNQALVAQTAVDVDEYLHDRFTNGELYDWMVARTSATYFQAYQLAYAVAKRAELCFRKELGLTDSSYIKFGYWDSLKKGLLSSDKLQLDLRSMEAAYYAQNVRLRELTKHVSLRTLDPHALVKLRTTGSCTIDVPELLFDLDNPGHYQRTLKTVGVTVPCVVGPYTGVSMTLTLLKNSIRTSTSVSPQYARSAAGDTRFVEDPGGVQAIVTSGAQNDAGVFELRLDEDRYLPFEGGGAISTWQLKLNPVYPQFDYTTISDVVLHLHYTARDSGVTLATPAATEVKAKLNAVALAESRAGLHRMISVKQEYATAWHKFLHPGGAGQDQVLTIETPPEGFAFFTQGLDLKVTEVEVLAKAAGTADYPLVVTRPGVPTPQTNALKVDPVLTGLHSWVAAPLTPKSPLGRAPTTGTPPTWTFKVQKPGATDFRSLSEADLEDLVLVLRYEVAP
jgi:peptidoglycan hydrolase-like protein with peptidoglycan-binding domain